MNTCVVFVCLNGNMFVSTLDQAPCGCAWQFLLWLRMPTAQKQRHCGRCGTQLRGRGGGWCWWCKKYGSVEVTTESPGSLWLQAQALLAVSSWESQMAMGLSLGMPRALQNMQASRIASDSDVEILETLDAFEMHVSPLSSDSDVGNQSRAQLVIIISYYHGRWSEALLQLC